MSVQKHLIACGPRKVSLLIILASLVALQVNVSVASGQDLKADAPYDLREGEIIKRDVQPGQVHLYRAALTQGQYMNIVVDNHSANLNITVSDPGRRKLLERRTRLYRPASLSLVAELSGTYSFEVRLGDKSEIAARYELRVLQLRVMTPQDRYALAAEKAQAEARDLREQWNAAALQEAIIKHGESINYWRKCGNHVQEAAALKDIGDIHFILSQNQKAIAYYERALSLAAVIDAYELRAETLNDLTAIELELGKTQMAREHCNKALELSRQIKSVRGEAQAVSNLGQIAYFESEMEKAVDLFNRAVSIWEPTADDRGKAETLMNLGYTYGDLGDIHKAIDRFNQALGLFERTGDRRGKAMALTVLGFVHASTGEIRKALEEQKQAEAIFHLLRNRTGEALVFNGLGYVYHIMGDLHKSLRAYTTALQLWRATGRRAGEEVALGLVGRIYAALGDKRKALYYYKQKLAIDRELKSQRVTAYTYKDIASVYYSLGQRDKALSYYKHALALNRSVNDPRGEAYTLNSIGFLREGRGEKREALALYNNAFALMRATEDRAGEIQTLQNLARVERDTGLLAQANDHIKLAISKIESLRSEVSNEEFRTSYFASVRRCYDLSVDILMQLHMQDPTSRFNVEAFEVSEKARARGLLEILATAKIDIGEGADPALLKRERELQQLFNAKTETLAKFLVGKDFERLIPGIKREIAEVSSEYEDVKAQIKLTSPRYAALTQPQTLTAVEVQERILDQNTLLLEYSLGDERSYLWAITPTSFKSYELPSRAEIEAVAVRLLNVVAAYQSGEAGSGTRQKFTLDELDEAYLRESKQLSDVLLGPVFSELGGKRLLIVAEGALQYVPFSALPAPGDSRGKHAQARAASIAAEPLVLNHEIINLPSASTLAVLRSQTAGRKAPDGAVAVIADPVFEKDDPRVTPSRQSRLPRAPLQVRARSRINSAQLIKNLRSSPDNGRFPRLLATRQEAETILRLAGESSSMKALDFDANISVVNSSEIAGYKIVHFATHGLLDSEQPKLSALVLSLVDEEGNQRNGFLRLQNIYNLKLPVELVVLSACNTALGKDIKGEGLVGVTRGFLYAGAARVVASLWKVDDDAAAMMMKDFYRKMLQDGERPAAALRAAQIEMWKREQWRAPYYWAAFVFQGEWK
jgi:CHAT domain-containing protein/tetratricopeptide (TPR) repeat protein